MTNNISMETKQKFKEQDLQNWQTNIPMKHACTDCYLHLVYSDSIRNWQYWVLKKIKSHIGKFTRVNNVFFPLGYELDILETPVYAPAEAHFIKAKRLPQWVKDHADQHLKNFPRYIHVVGAVLWYDNDASNTERQTMAAAIEASTNGLVFAYRIGKTREPYTWDSVHQDFLVQQNENLSVMTFYNTYPPRKENKFYPITNACEDYGGDY